MAKLFELTEIKDLQLPNRFIRSAAHGLANDDGTCSPELVDAMVELARGGVGLIITGHAYVSQGGQAQPRQLAVYNDRFIEGLAELSEAVHREGGRIMMQVAHVGLRGDPKLTGQSPIGPSTVGDMGESSAREMTPPEIQGVVVDFGHAARRAKEAGFDGVQIHGAHGYLLNQFLSPAHNRRTDNYGGTVENRARVLLEVLKSIRLNVGRNFPVFIKINSEDFLPGGLNQGDFIQASVMLDRAGIDAIEVSGGTPSSGRFIPFRKEITFERDQAYFRKPARALKAKIKAPVILVGGIRSYLLAERLVTEGVSDYIAMCRPFIREPNLIERWHSGDLRKATCISCNGCFDVSISGQGLYCVQERKIQAKRS